MPKTSDASKLSKSLARMHPQVRRMVADRMSIGDEPLYSNNQNRQMLTYYELFRQVAEAMLHDGGPDIAEEMVSAVIKEMRVRYNSDSRGDGSRTRNDPNLDLEETGWFMEM